MWAGPSLRPFTELWLSCNLSLSVNTWKQTERGDLARDWRRREWGWGGDHAQTSRERERAPIGRVGEIGRLVRGRRRPVLGSLFPTLSSSAAFPATLHDWQFYTTVLSLHVDSSSHTEKKKSKWTNKIILKQDFCNTGIHMSTVFTVKLYSPVS